MSLPNSTIVKAFIETYLSYRKSTWKLDVQSDGLKIPEDKIIHHKLTICIDILKAIDNATTFEDWLNVLDVIYTKEHAEFDAHQNRYASTRAIIWPPFAGEMLRAARTYAVSELKNNASFQALKTTLTSEKIDLANEIWVDKNAGITPQEIITEKQRKLDVINQTLEARNDQDTYFLTFFTERVLKYDAESAILKEKTIEDFKANVIQEKRKLAMCQRLTDNKAKKTAEIQTSQPSEVKAETTPQVESTVEGTPRTDQKVETTPQTEAKVEKTPEINNSSVAQPSSSPEVALPPPPPPLPARPQFTSTSSSVSQALLFPNPAPDAFFKKPPQPPIRRQPPRVAKGTTISLAEFNEPAAGVDGQPISYHRKGQGTR